MKYIKKFEGVKSKWQENIDLQNKSKKFIPGAYIIYIEENYNYVLKSMYETLILAKIQKAEKVERRENSYSTNMAIKFLLTFEIIEYISEAKSISNKLRTYDIDFFDHKNRLKGVEIKFQDALNKYNEEKKKFEEKITINKYNL